MLQLFQLFARVAALCRMSAEVIRAWQGSEEVVLGMKLDFEVAQMVMKVAAVKMKLMTSQRPAEYG